MHRNQSAISPIANIKGLLIFCGEFRTCSKDDTGRTTDADRRRLRQAIRVVLRPLGTPFPEAVVSTTDRMEHMDRTIPRAPPIPFHVAVEAKQFSIGIKTNVIRVSLTRGIQFGILPIQIDASHKATGGLPPRTKTVAIFGSLQCQVVAIVAVRRGRCQVFGDIHEIPTDDVQHSVWPQDNPMRTMFAGSPLPLTQAFHIVVAVVPLRILAAE